MSTSDILRLEEYRGRRQQRLRRILTLHQGNPVRSLVLGRLADIAGALKADRVVAAWIDEYGGARPHPYAVLDVAAHPPRRGLDADLLIRSWRAGVPGIASADLPDGSGGAQVAVSLGSDGFRLWFVHVERTHRPLFLTGSHLDLLMFLVGECGSILLHQDLDESTEPRGQGVLEEDAAFPGRGPDPEAEDALADLAGFVLEECMVPEPGPLEYRLEVAMRTLPTLDERAGPAAVLEAARRADPEALAAGLGRMASAREADGDYGRAGELYGLAYEAACHAGAYTRGGKAARGRARSLRRAGRWDEALSWYDLARGIARETGDLAEEAVALDGAASVHLGRGGVPSARAILEAAGGLARRSGDPDALAAVRFSLMTVAHTEGRLDEAATHGWEAFQGFRTRAARLRTLTALGGVFLAGRRFDAAEDAFTVVERETREAYYRLHALAGLARIEAARGDRSAYEAALRRLDDAGLERGAPELRAEVCLERGDGYRELGAVEEARRSYREAVVLAEAHRVGEYLIRAERALEELEAEWPEAEGSEPAAPVEPGEGADDLEDIRRDLGALRRGAAGVGGIG